MKQFLLLIVFASAAFAAKAQPTHQVGNTTLTEFDLVTGVNIPWEILWGPDDHIWVTQRSGEVLRINPQTGNTTTVLDLSDEISNGGSGEPGMLGMAMHPDWENTPEVFIVYNFGQSWDIKQRLVKFTWDGTELVDESLLLNNLPGGGIHNGSRLLILEDNTLLMTTGDVGNGDNAQDMDSFAGKILRINLDGSIPDDNPFGPASYIYTLGHRNAQGLCLGPNGLIYSSEHGATTNDEFNIIEAGRNYGWPEVQGFCDNQPPGGGDEMTPCEDLDVREPLEAWTPCIAVNGIKYYTHEAIPEWQGKVLMAVLGGLGGNAERLSVLELNADGTDIVNEEQYFSSFNQRIRDICVNPYNGAVYVAFNGPSYPGFGPNSIKEFRNMDFVSVEETDATPTQFINLYPNPTRDQLHLEFSDEFLGTNFHIFSFDGREMGRYIVAENQVRMRIADWAAGKYYLTASTPQGTITKTFLKR
jgi:glucose/arabinose dehydrogenase